MRSTLTVALCAHRLAIGGAGHRGGVDEGCFRNRSEAPRECPRDKEKQQACACFPLPLATAWGRCVSSAVQAAVTATGSRRPDAPYRSRCKRRSTPGLKVHDRTCRWTRTQCRVGLVCPGTEDRTDKSTCTVFNVGECHVGDRHVAGVADGVGVGNDITDRTFRGVIGRLDEADAAAVESSGTAAEALDAVTAVLL